MVDTTDLEPMDTDPMVPSPTLMDTMLLARDMLMPTTMVDTTDLEPMDTDLMVPTPTTDLMATTLLARGLLMLSLLLMPMPTITDIPPMDTDPMVPTPTDMLPPMPTDPMVLTPTEPDTTDTGKLPIP